MGFGAVVLVWPHHRILEQAQSILDLHPRTKSGLHHKCRCKPKKKCHSSCIAFNTDSWNNVKINNNFFWSHELQPISSQTRLVHMWWGEFLEVWYLNRFIYNQLILEKRSRTKVKTIYIYIYIPPYISLRYAKRFSKLYVLLICRLHIPAWVRANLVLHGRWKNANAGCGEKCTICRNLR